MVSRAKGFTLLEVLIATSLMILLMAALVTGLHIGTRAWQQGEARLRGIHRDEELSGFLARQISSLVPYAAVSREPELPGRLPILEATPLRLRFLSTYGSRFGNRAGLLLVECAVSGTSPGKVAVVLRETPVRGDRMLLDEMIERVIEDSTTGKKMIVFKLFSVREGDLSLLTGLDRAQFEYLDPAAPSGEPSWLPKWEDRPDAPYPAAIRLRWERGGREQRQTIPIRAHVLPR